MDDRDDSGEKEFHGGENNGACETRRTRSSIVADSFFFYPYPCCRCRRVLALSRMILNGVVAKLQHYPVSFIHSFIP